MQEKPKIEITKLDDIKHMLTGIGRLIQYSCHNSSNLDESKSRSLNLIYEGQFKKGKVDGFGIVIYPDIDSHFAGYYKNGFKYGKGVALRTKQLNLEETDEETLRDKIKDCGIWDYLQ